MALLLHSMNLYTPCKVVCQTGESYPEASMQLSQKLEFLFDDHDDLRTSSSSSNLHHRRACHTVICVHRESCIRSIGRKRTEIGNPSTTSDRSSAAASLAARCCRHSAVTVRTRSAGNPAVCTELRMHTQRARNFEEFQNVRPPSSLIRVNPCLIT